MSFAEYVTAEGNPCPIPQGHVLSWEDGIRYTPHECMAHLRAVVNKRVKALELRPTHEGYTQYRILPSGHMYVGRFDAATNLLTVCSVQNVSLVPDNVRQVAVANTADISERIALRAGKWGTPEEVSGLLRKWASAVLVTEEVAASPA